MAVSYDPFEISAGVHRKSLNFPSQILPVMSPYCPLAEATFSVTSATGK